MSAVPPLVIALVLGAAVLHATWNALLKSGLDRLWSIVLMCAVAAVASGVAVFFVPLPTAGAWGCAILSAALQIGYCLFLVRAYDRGELGQVYPIARGSAPLLVAAGGAAIAHEHLSTQAVAGLVLISGGIVALGRGKNRLDAATAGDAAIAGGFIAAYMVTDGIGVRLAGNAFSYVAWMTLLQGAPMPLVYLAMRRRFPALRPDAETLKALGGGVLGLVAYAVVVWAMSLAPLAKVSGLRETSILFAAILGALFLGERFTLRKGACALAITGGALLLAS
ncbi:MAG: EamA family transporter [Proteobacteria bacterium]|nr:EamA family transporter [Pseudomonadota bacterium]